MPRITRQAELAEAEKVLDGQRRYVDLAVRLRILDEDGAPGPHLPRVLGGRWDTWELRWVTPQPADLEVVEWTIQVQQLALLELPDDVLFVALFSGRQAGKTYAAVLDLVLDVIRSPGRDFAIISLDFKASRDPEKTFSALLSPTWGVKPVKTDRAYLFPHGARVVFRSEEAIESVRGPSLKRILMDEAAYMAHESFVTAVGCGGASAGFRLALATTPKRDQRWIRDIDSKWGSNKDGTPKDPECRIIRFDSERNPRRNKKLLAKLKQQLPPDLYDQEFRGLLVPPQHAVYYLFKRETHEKDLRLEIPRWTDYTREFTQREFKVACDRVAGWDFGIEAVVVGKIYRRRQDVTDEFGRIHSGWVEALQVVGEVVSDRTTTEQHALDVKKIYGTSIAIFCDAMGAHENADGKGASSPKIRLLDQAGFAYVRPVGSVNPRVENRIVGVNRLLKNAEQQTRLWILPGAAPNLLEALENQERGPDGKPLKNTRGRAKGGTEDGKVGYEHPVDALGYLVWMCFPIEGVLPDGAEPAVKPPRAAEGAE